MVKDWLWGTFNDLKMGNCSEICADMQQGPDMDVGKKDLMYALIEGMCLHVFGGTNPSEGAALGMSLLECFAEAGALRLALSAGVYQIWNERNKRLFQNMERDWESVYKAIIDEVRGRLTSLKEYGVIEMVGLMIVIDAYHGCFYVFVSVRIGVAVGIICYLYAGNVALMSLVTST
nr:hypothetical protein [Tanacetum cinerariifolium]